MRKYDVPESERVWKGCGQEMRLSGALLEKVIYDLESEEYGRTQRRKGHKLKITTMLCPEVCWVASLLGMETVTD